MTQFITYRFYAPGNEKITVDLVFDEHTYRLMDEPDTPTPDWARLEYQKCPNCPLGDNVEWCPAALAIARFLPEFESRVSYERAVVEVETPFRTVVSKTTFQTGMASLIGLVCATSGCPLTLFLRPMARFHLPFANEQETVFRTLSTYLLKVYVENSKACQGTDKAFTFDHLKTCYAELSTVNACLAERLRDAVQRDAALNAVIILDSFAQIAPENIDFGFEDLRDVFAPDVA